MVAAARACLSPVLRKACPEFGAGAGFQGMGSDPHDAPAVAGIGTTFTRLLKKIDTPLRPIHAPRAIRALARAAEIMLKVGQQSVEPLQMMCSLIAHMIDGRLPGQLIRDFPGDFLHSPKTVARSNINRKRGIFSYEQVPDYECAGVLQSK